MKECASRYLGLSVENQTNPNWNHGGYGFSSSLHQQTILYHQRNYAKELNKSGTEKRTVFLYLILLVIHYLVGNKLMLYDCKICCGSEKRAVTKGFTI